jgi:hypothetical protein
MANERWRCPYRFCQENILLVGPKKTVIRKHTYEGYGDCPGSGYDIGKPAATENAKMLQRENKTLKEK